MNTPRYKRASTPGTEEAVALQVERQPLEKPSDIAHPITAPLIESVVYKCRAMISQTTSGIVSAW